MTGPSIVLLIDAVNSRGRRGGAIVTGDTVTGERYAAVFDYTQLADSSLIDRGQQWQISGEHQIWRGNRNGRLVEQRQIKVTRAELLHPAGQNIVQWISRSPDCPGIGTVKANKLWCEFGDALIDMIEARDIDALSTVVTRESAQLLCHAIDKLSIAKSLFWLDQIGIPSRIGLKVVDFYKDRLQSAIEENPYVLLAFEAKWEIVDAFARTRLGVSDDDPRRLEAAVEEVLYRGFARGHTCLPEAKMRKGVRALLGSKHALALVSQNGRWHCEDGLYHAAGSYIIERYIAERLSAMAAGERVEGEQGIFSPPEPDGEAVAKALDAYEASQGFELTAEQSQAVLTSTGANLSMILGGAGCGKTTVLRALYSVLEVVQPNIGIYQVALAGRAAQRMTEATGRESLTIAAFLSRVESEDLQPGTLIVCDEASMVDAFLFYRLLRRLPKGVRLILVGDPAQLPPIGPGLVLHSLAGHAVIPQTTLTVTKRQSAASGIPKVAMAIRNHQAPTYAEYRGLGSGVSFVNCPEHELDETVLQVYEELGGRGRDYDVQILSPTKSRAGGTRNLNLLLHNRFRIGAEPVYYYDIYGGYGTVQAVTNERVLLRVGDLVLFTINDYELELRNGSLGRITAANLKSDVTSVDSDCCVIEWDDGRRLALKTRQIHGLTHAYALTIHKSQGSQFKRVIVPIRRNRLLDQALIYTVVTRAVEQVVFIGDEHAVLEVIQAPSKAMRRHVGLSSMLSVSTLRATGHYQKSDMRQVLICK